MSFWRKKQIAELVEKDNEPETVEAPAPEPDIDVTRACYTIGKNNAGNIQMVMPLNYADTSTLTMESSAVAFLIRQLAVYIENDYVVEIKKVSKE